VTNLVFPKLAKATAKGDDNEARLLTVNSIKSIILVIMPLMVIFIILAAPVTSVIYEHNNFTSDDASAVTLALRCYSAGMLGLALNEVLSKVFFSKQNSKTPMINSVISMVFNIITAYILFKYLKTSGLALAAAMGSVFNAILNAFCIRKDTGGLLVSDDIKEIGKIIASSLTSGAVVFVLYNALKVYLSGAFFANLILAGICGIIGVIVYIMCAFLMKIELLTETIKSLIKR